MERGRTIVRDGQSRGSTASPCPATTSPPARRRDEPCGAGERRACPSRPGRTDVRDHLYRGIVDLFPALTVPVLVIRDAALPVLVEDHPQVEVRLDGRADVAGGQRKAGGDDEDVCLVRHHRHVRERAVDVGGDIQGRVDRLRDPPHAVDHLLRCIDRSCKVQVRRPGHPRADAPGDQEQADCRFHLVPPARLRQEQSIVGLGLIIGQTLLINSNADDQYKKNPGIVPKWATGLSPDYSNCVQ